MKQIGIKIKDKFERNGLKMTEMVIFSQNVFYVYSSASSFVGYDPRSRLCVRRYIWKMSANSLELFSSSDTTMQHNFSLRNFPAEMADASSTCFDSGRAEYPLATAFWCRRRLWNFRRPSFMLQRKKCNFALWVSNRCSRADRQRGDIRFDILFVF